MDYEDEPGPKGHVAVRLGTEIIARIDALRPLYELPGRKGTRSDAVRAALLSGIEVEERKAAALRRAPPG